MNTSYNLQNKQILEAVITVLFNNYFLKQTSQQIAAFSHSHYIGGNYHGLRWQLLDSQTLSPN